MIHKKYGVALIIIITFLLCNQFSSQNSSVNGREKPSLNVYGLLTDSTNNNYYIENITVAGRYNDIAVYKRPINQDTNPDINTTRLDLCSLSEIRIETQQVFQFNKRDYIEITAISNDARRTQNKYLIEKLKKLFCDEVNDAGPIEKELSFLAVKRLQIQGCKKQDEETCAQQRKTITSATPPADNMHSQPTPLQQIAAPTVDTNITKTQSLIKELQETAEQLSDHDDGTIKSQILQILNDLKESVKNWFA